MVNRRLAHLERAIYECLVSAIGRLPDWFGPSHGSLAKGRVAQPDRQSAKPCRGQKCTPLNDWRSPTVRLCFFMPVHLSQSLDRFRVGRKRLAEVGAQEDTNGHHWICACITIEVHFSKAATQRPARRRRFCLLVAPAFAARQTSEDTACLSTNRW